MRMILRRQVRGLHCDQVGKEDGVEGRGVHVVCLCTLSPCSASSVPQRGGLQEYAWNNKPVYPLRAVLLFLADYSSIQVALLAIRTCGSFIIIVHRTDGDVV